MFLKITNVKPLTYKVALTGGIGGGGAVSHPILVKGGGSPPKRKGVDRIYRERQILIL